MEGILDFVGSVPESPRDLLDFVIGLLISHGYLVIFVGAALDNFGLPASGDIVLFAGGFFANDGRASLPLVMLSAAVGALVSDNAVYWIGRYGGRPLIERIARTRVLSFLLDAKSIGKVERYFEDHGRKSVFVGRFGPGLRSMTPLFAGVSQMKYHNFIPFNLAAVVVWSTAYGTVGYVFGEYWSELLAVARSVGYGFVALAVLFIVLYILRRRRTARVKRIPKKERFDPEEE